MKIINVSDKILSGKKKIENRPRNKQATARRRSADTETTPLHPMPLPPIWWTIWNTTHTLKSHKIQSEAGFILNSSSFHIEGGFFSKFL